MTIAIASLGSVGLSNDIFLAKPDRVEEDAMVNRANTWTSPIDAPEIDECIVHRSLNPRATLDKQDAYAIANFMIIATLTEYDIETSYLNTRSIELVSKSTVSVGYTVKQEQPNVIVSAEFLREGRAHYENLHPSRIVIGEIGGSVCRVAEQEREYFKA